MRNKRLVSYKPKSKERERERERGVLRKGLKRKKGRGVESRGPLIVG